MTSVAFLLFLSAATSIVPPAHAASSSVVQQASGSCVLPGCTAISISLRTAVVPGDLLVVGIATDGSSQNSVSDSVGSTFTEAVLSCSGVLTTGFSGACADVFYSAPPRGGTDTVAVTLSSSSLRAGAYVYEVSGVTSSGLATAKGTGSGSGQLAFSTSSSVPFSSGSFLLGVIDLSGSVTNFAAGAGFAADTSNSPVGAYAEASTGAAVSSTNFPAAGSTIDARSWAEAGVVFGPATGQKLTAALRDGLGVTDRSALPVAAALKDAVNAHDVREAPILASLDEVVHAVDEHVSPVSASLDEAIKFIDRYASVSAALSDVVGVVDEYTTPVMASLSDAVRAIDHYTAPVAAELKDVVGINDHLKTSVGVVLVTAGAGLAVFGGVLAVRRERKRRR